METLGPTDFDGTVLKRDGDVMACFAASWCPFCRRFLPQFESDGQGRPYAIAFVDLSDESNPLWERFDIAVVPTIVVFRDGREVGRRPGRLGRGLNERDLAAARAMLSRGKPRASPPL